MVVLPKTEDKTGLNIVLHGWSLKMMGYTPVQLNRSGLVRPIWAGSVDFHAILVRFKLFGGGRAIVKH
uniref:Uncharacterized protein n=1 Tax=Cucumis melo TaxID=3656 RepID=A0A9I9CFD7_CUCME